MTPVHWLGRTLLRLAGTVAVATVLLLAAGQTGLLSGQPPTNLGVHQGRLAPPRSTPNSVSSQAGLYPEHPQRLAAQIAPLAYRGDADAAMARLAALMAQWPRTRIVASTPGYLRAECRTAWLGFTDDIEFLADPVAGVIQVRSASRLGHSDLGVNRERVEAIRARFQASAP